MTEKMEQGDNPPLAKLRLAGRVILLAAIVAGIAIAGTHRDALQPAAIEAALSHSAAAPVVYLAAHVVASLLFIPRALVAAAAGLMFGLWWGLIWATIGSVLGSAAGFLVARYINSGLIELEALPRLGPYFLRAERGGWPVVALIRLLPIMNHGFVNYALGLTKVSFGAYLLGSFLGQNSEHRRVRRIRRRRRARGQRPGGLAHADSDRTGGVGGRVRATIFLPQAGPGALGSDRP